VKFLDEYFWLSHGDGLAIPPVWIPSWHGTSGVSDTNHLAASLDEHAVSAKAETGSFLDQAPP